MKNYLHTEGQSYSAFVRLVRVVRVPILFITHPKEINSANG